MNYLIVEFHDGKFNCVYGPYANSDDAYEHRDRLINSNYVKRSPFKITYQLVTTYPSTYVP